MSGVSGPSGGPAPVAPPVRRPADHRHHDGQQRRGGHREESAGDPLRCPDRQRGMGRVGRMVADQSGHDGRDHVGQRRDRDDQVRGARANGYGPGRRPGEQEDAEYGAGFASGHQRAEQANRGSAEDQRDPQPPGAGAPPAARETGRGRAPALRPATTRIAAAHRRIVPASRVAAACSRVSAGQRGIAAACSRIASARTRIAPACVRLVSRPARIPRAGFRLVPRWVQHLSLKVWPALFY